MDFYKKIIFVFILFIFFTAVLVKMIEPVFEKQISNIFAEKKLSTKLKKELQKSTAEFTPEKKEFYKSIIKELYIKWKPLIDESINEAKKEIDNNS